MCPVFAKLLACLLMQWRLLLWDQILLCTFTAKVNHLYVKEKSTHWKKADPCSDENNKTEFWKHKQIKLLICPHRGRENWSSKQIKINTVTGNKSTRVFPKEHKTTLYLTLMKCWFSPLYTVHTQYVLVRAGQAAYSEMLDMFKMLYRNKVQREWVLAGGFCMPWLTSVLLHHVNSVGRHWEDSKPNTKSLTHLNNAEIQWHFLACPAVII